LIQRIQHSLAGCHIFSYNTSQISALLDYVADHTISFSVHIKLSLLYCMLNANNITLP